MSYKRIMVAVDGSETSGLALIEAIHLSKSFVAQLCLVHVVDAFPIYNLGMGIDFDRYREIVREDGLVILNKAKHVAKKHDVVAETRLIEIIDANKKISEKLIQAIESDQADLLILGTHGRRGFRRLILGSVAEETIRIASVPILLVRAEEGTANYYLQKKEWPYNRIVVAIDGSETANAALKQAIYLTQTLRATLCILHLANEFTTKDFFFATHLIQYQESVKYHGQEILEKAKECCQNSGLIAETLLMEINNKTEWVSEKIIETILSFKADLLVIGTHGRSGINRFLLGSIAEETVRRAPIPVLLVRAEATD